MFSDIFFVVYRDVIGKDCHFWCYTPFWMSVVIKLVATNYKNRTTQLKYSDNDRI